MRAERILLARKQGKSSSGGTAERAKSGKKDGNLVGSRFWTDLASRECTRDYSGVCTREREIAERNKEFKEKGRIKINVIRRTHKHSYDI